MGLFHQVSFIARLLASLSRLPAISASTFVISIVVRLIVLCLLLMVT